MLEALVDSLKHEGGDFLIKSQGLGDVKSHVWMFGGGGSGQSRNIGGGVLAGGEEIRMNDDQRGPLGYAAVEGLGDGGLGQFHMGGFDDLGFGNAFEDRDDIEEQIVGGGFGRAVIDDYQA